MRRKLPDHIPGSIKRWRVQKRREWAAVIAAVNVFHVGSAFTPVDIYHVRSELEKIHEALRGDWDPWKKEGRKS